jgi:hypothetical protein
MHSRTAPSGRFIYAAYKTMQRLNERVEDMIAEGEMSPSEYRVETIRDHRGHVECYAVTIA